ncbi:MAG: glycyl-radical enzyme activating protein [Desulfobacterales bacterium]|nr:glycyl-radical enzyme activating protein [Desulfobacterales bacterium]
MGPNSGIIFRIKKYAIHDGPGIRTTVFFKGCPLDCWWCHNPEGIRMAPEICRSAENSGKRPETLGVEMTVAKVMAAVEKDVVFYDDSGGGATFSGGEPLMQPDFLFTLLDACRQRDIHTILDTSGYAPADTFQAAIEKVDGVLFDLKLMDATVHKTFTGVSNELILANFKTAAQSGKAQVRFPVIPGITDHMENIDGLLELAASSGMIQRFDILPYHRTATAKYKRLGLENRMKDSEPPTREQVEIVKERIAKHGFTAHVGG